MPLPKALALAQSHLFAPRLPRSHPAGRGRSSGHARATVAPQATATFLDIAVQRERHLELFHRFVEVVLCPCHKANHAVGVRHSALVAQPSVNFRWFPGGEARLESSPDQTQSRPVLAWPPSADDPGPPHRAPTPAVVSGDLRSGARARPRIPERPAKPQARFSVTLLVEPLECGAEVMVRLEEIEVPQLLRSAKQLPLSALRQCHEMGGMRIARRTMAPVCHEHFRPYWRIVSSIRKRGAPASDSAPGQRIVLEQT